MPENKDKSEEKPVVVKTAIDLQRLKLQKLMKNPEKPIILPERPKAKNTPSVPEFVRNVMGSSAGAGSGEFHVYRHLRRKEYARQKFIQEKGRKELLDEEYHQKLEENKKMAEEVTAKKRAKRLKKKQKWKQKKRMKLTTNTVHQDRAENSNSEEDSSDEQEVNNEKDSIHSDICSNNTTNNVVQMEMTIPAKDNLSQDNVNSTTDTQNECDTSEDGKPDRNTEENKDHDSTNNER